MAATYSLPPPPALEIHDPQAAEKWKKFKLAWVNYALATELNTKSEPVQVATLLTVIGEEAREVFSTFVWTTDGDSAKITPVLDKFATYCQPCKNIPFERYRFNRRMQEPGESYDQYSTALRKLAEGCDFAHITSEEILRDRLVFGISDNKVRERLLRESMLTLAKTNEICHAAESMSVQMKMVEEGTESKVSAVSQDRFKKTMTEKSKECWNCGRRHEHYQKELCPAYGKTCRKCKKLNHFAVKCRGTSNKESQNVRVLEEDGEETFPVQVAAVALDDAQLVTLRLESGKYVRFQPDTGAQCNVLPVDLYRKATGDHKLTKAIPINMKITAYGGHALPVVGSVLLRVWRGSFRCKLDCKLVVDRVHKVNTAGVTKVLRPMFARYGIPDTLMTDNGPQFDSAEFSTFAKKWGFKHDTSSPRYPQSNGKAENAVKTVKQLFTKCQETGQSEYLALLDWRNTPTEGLNTSPAQRLLGRRCKTRLPITESLLEPQFSTKEDMKALQCMKQRQKHYYDLLDL